MSVLDGGNPRRRREFATSPYLLGGRRARPSMEMHALAGFTAFGMVVALRGAMKVEVGWIAVRALVLRRTLRDQGRAQESLVLDKPHRLSHARCRAGVGGYLQAQQADLVTLHRAQGAGV
jgi:hypothetical protein